MLTLRYRVKTGLLCKKVLRTTAGKRYLQSSTGLYRDELGYYYEVFDNNNGFSGCVNWTKPLFTRDLYFGRSGYDVYLLQNALIREGVLESGFNTGYFGATLSAVQRLQMRQHIDPTLGYVGRMTRAYLNVTYPTGL
jgi:hypothetical protein